ncbi:DUF4157 domain-containing protein [Streptomyces sp. NPDC059900]|uniref:eCIS core domain-containing protein n=1 Tax=Streptomyces sp. NPDC059900 TaxID=3155816 RepID=UPI00342D523B
MHVHGRQGQRADDQREARQAGKPGKPSTPAGQLLKLQGQAGNLAVSRALEETQHAHGPGCGHARTPTGDPAVQRRMDPEETTSARDADLQRRSTLAAGIASPGRPLESRIRDKAERVYPMKFDHVQWHDGPVAQRAAREFGAQALTVGPHILAAEPNLPDEVKLHEVDHTYQNAMGDVAGTADGAGTKVSSPHDPYEVSAASNGKKVAQGGTPDLSLPGRPAPVQRSTIDADTAAGTDHAVQRYAVVRPGDDGYPERGRQSPGGTRTTVPQGDFLDESGADFFPGQNMKSRLVRKPTGEEVEKDSYVDASGKPNIVYNGLVPLKISDNLDLAVEHTGDGRQAKMFFATDQQIGRANEKLGGRVKMERSGSHYLSINVGDTTKTLWRVQPVVTRPGKKSSDEGAVTRGLAATLPQRCNSIANRISGQGMLPDVGTDAYFHALGGILSDVKSKLSLKMVPTAKDYDKAKAELDGNKPKTVEKFTQVMQRLIEGVLSHRGEPRLEEALKRRGLNQYTPPAEIGDVLMTKTQAPERGGPREFDFHFTTAVATSGSDSVTMENYARGEEEKTLSSGDQQWFFSMNGTAKSGQSFHEQWGHLDRDGRVRLTILMRGA